MGQSLKDLQRLLEVWRGITARQVISIHHVAVGQRPDLDQGQSHTPSLDQGATYTKPGPRSHLHQAWTKEPPTPSLDQGATYTKLGPRSHLHQAWTKEPPAPSLDQGATYTKLGPRSHLHQAWTKEPTLSLDDFIHEESLPSTLYLLNLVQQAHSACQCTIQQLSTQVFACGSHWFVSFSLAEIPTI